MGSLRQNLCDIRPHIRINRIEESLAPRETQNDFPRKMVGFIVSIVIDVFFNNIY